MPIIDFTNPIYVVVALILVLLCIFLAKQYKKNTIPCIVLLVFLAILVGHTIELSALENADVSTYAVSIAVDEIFIFISFFAYLWVDDIEVKVNGKKSIDNSLEWLWKKV